MKLDASFDLMNSLQNLAEKLKGSADVSAPSEKIDGPLFYVVGDKFRSFSDNNTVLAYSEALEHVSILARSARAVVLGQGISGPEADELTAKILAKSGMRAIEVVDWRKLRGEGSLVRQTRGGNVLITPPRKISSLRFQSELVLDGDYMDLFDCPVDRHVQGMLLIEAARQMFMTCALSGEVLPDFFDQGEKIRFTLGRMEIDFEHFVFPLETVLTLQFSSLQSNGSFATGCAEVKIQQFGRACCSVKFQANAYSERLYNSLETRSAIRARARFVESNQKDNKVERVTI